MSDAINIGGAPASLEQQFETPASPSTDVYWGGPASIQFDAAGGDHALAPAGFANAQAFGVPALRGTLAPAGHANTSSFGVPALHGRLAPAGHANTSVFGQPTVVIETEHELQPAGFANVQAFGVPALHGTIAPSGFANETAFGQPTVDPVEISHAVVDGSGLRIIRKGRRAARAGVKPRDFYRTPEDIRREQLETERYLASLEKPQQVPASERRRTEPKTHQATTPAAHPILADIAARAASAVQAKIEEADSAAALGLLAEQQQRRQTLVLLLALD